MWRLCAFVCRLVTDFWLGGLRCAGCLTGVYLWARGFTWGQGSGHVKVRRISIFPWLREVIWTIQSQQTWAGLQQCYNYCCDTLIYIYIEREAGRQAGRQRQRNRERQTDRQKKTDRQTERCVFVSVCHHHSVTTRWTWLLVASQAMFNQMSQKVCGNFLNPVHGTNFFPSVLFFQCCF